MAEDFDSRARSAWAALQAAGGVITRTQLAQTWQLTAARVHTVTTSSGFPAPVIEGTHGLPALWLTADVEHWRRAWSAQRGPDVARPALLQHRPDPRAAHRHWCALNDTGGLATVQHLATTWSISRTSAARYLAHHTRPQPISPGRWLTAEALAARDRNAGRRRAAIAPVSSNDE